MAPLLPGPLKGSRMDYCLSHRSREAVSTTIHQQELVLRKPTQLPGTGAVYPALPSCFTFRDPRVPCVKDGSPISLWLWFSIWALTSQDGAFHSKVNTVPTWGPRLHVQHRDQSPSYM